MELEDDYDPWPLYEPADEEPAEGLNAIQKWNAQHIWKWLNRHEAPMHSTSLISHFAANSNSGLAITEAGELIFGRDEGLGLCITCEGDPDFRLTTRKFRFFYDLLLEYEANGYKVEEYSLEESPFYCTIPSSKGTSRPVASPEAPEEPTENTTDLEQELKLDHIVNQQRPAVASQKRHRHKTAHQRRHCLGTGRLVKLRKRRALVEHQKSRDSAIHRERSNKQWRLADLDGVYPTWRDCDEFFRAEEEERKFATRSWCDDQSIGWGGWTGDWGGSWGDDWEDDGWEPIPPEALLPVTQTVGDTAQSAAVPAPPSLSLLETVEEEEVEDGGVLAILGLY